MIWAGLQLVLLIVIAFLLRFQSNHMSMLSEMFTKPVSGVIYGDQGGDPIDVKLRYHRPPLHVAYVGLFCSMVQTASQLYVSTMAEVDNLDVDSLNAEVVYVLYPTNCVSGALLGFLTLYIFIYPERKMIWLTFLRRTGMLECYMEMCGWHGKGLNVSYTFIDTGEIDDALAAQADYHTVMEKTQLLFRSPSEEVHDDLDLVQRKNSMLDHVHGTNEGFDPEANAGIPGLPEDSLSPRHGPDQDEIVDGGLMSNPAFRDRGGSTLSLDMSLEDGAPIPDVLSPRSTYQ